MEETGNGSGWDITFLAVHGFTVLYGILQCFFGYRLIRIILGILGFAGGASLGFFYGQYMGDSMAVRLIMGILIGGFAAWLAMVIYIVGVFIVGAFLGALVSSSVMQMLGIPVDQYIVLGSALFGGILTLIEQKPVLILATSLNGAGMIVYGLIPFFRESASVDTFLESFQNNMRNFFTNDVTLFYSWLMIGFAGIVIQIITTRGVKHYIRVRSPAKKIT